MRRLFVDTSGWVALNDQRDARHAVAKGAFATLLEQPLRLISTDFVLDETLSFLLRRTGHAATVRFGNATRRDPVADWIHVDEAVWAAAWALFVRYDDKDFSFTDCTSFAVMRSLGLIEAFTFDEHFRQAGYQMWPPPS